MNTYQVFFDGVFQGEYKASDADSALDQWSRGYHVKNVGGDLGNYSMVKKGSPVKDIKNMKTSCKTRLWHFFFGKEPIVWIGK